MIDLRNLSKHTDLGSLIWQDTTVRIVYETLDVKGTKLEGRFLKNTGNL